MGSRNQIMAGGAWCILGLLALLAVGQGFPTTHSSQHDLGESEYDSDEVQLMSRAELVKDDIAAHKARAASEANAKISRDRMKAGKIRNQADSKATQFAKHAADLAWKAEEAMAAKVQALEKENAALQQGARAKLTTAKHAADLAWKAEADIAAKLQKQTKELKKAKAAAAQSPQQKQTLAALRAKRQLSDDQLKIIAQASAIKKDEQELKADEAKLKVARATIKADQKIDAKWPAPKPKQELEQSIMSSERTALKHDESLLSKVQHKVSRALKNDDTAGGDKKAKRHGGKGQESQAAE